MSARQALMRELEVIPGGAHDRWVDTLRRITDLFIVTSSQLTGEQVDLFDAVLTHAMARVESTAHAELAERLAAIDRAPREVIRQLAHDDDINIAGPVLSRSNTLTSEDLLGLAQHMGEAHLLAIARRPALDQCVIEMLLDRVSPQVLAALACNAGAVSHESGQRAAAE
jgi:uncharacterized protein (DUF2336 family)